MYPNDHLSTIVDVLASKVEEQQMLIDYLRAENKKLSMLNVMRSQSMEDEIAALEGLEDDE